MGAVGGTLTDRVPFTEQINAAIEETRHTLGKAESVARQLILLLNHNRRRPERPIKDRVKWAQLKADTSALGKLAAGRDSEKEGVSTSDDEAIIRGFFIILEAAVELSVVPLINE